MKTTRPCALTIARMSVPLGVSAIGIDTRFRLMWVVDPLARPRPRLKEGVDRQDTAFKEDSNRWCLWILHWPWAVILVCLVVLMDPFRRKWALFVLFLPLPLSIKLHSFNKHRRLLRCWQSVCPFLIYHLAKENDLALEVNLTGKCEGFLDCANTRDKFEII